MHNSRPGSINRRRSVCGFSSGSPPFHSFFHSFRFFLFFRHHLLIGLTPVRRAPVKISDGISSSRPFSFHLFGSVSRFMLFAVAKFYGLRPSTRRFLSFIFAFFDEERPAGFSVERPHAVFGESCEEMNDEERKVFFLFLSIFHYNLTRLTNNGVEKYWGRINFRHICCYRLQMKQLHNNNNKIQNSK